MCLIKARISDGGNHAQLSQRVRSERLPTTPSEAFMATQTEVLRQILQAHEQIAQWMN
jgi:hypothetical protein